MLPERIVVAIDGPAASGKSTVGEQVAVRLGAISFDTGLLYRAVTWAVQQAGVAIEDQEAVTQIAEQMVFELADASVADGRPSDIFVNGEDVTWQLRRLGVDSGLSTISAYPGVRDALLEQQRAIAERAGRIVMLGRDIGTVVLPGADVKIYLSASVEERARRRLRDHLDQGDDTTYEAVLEQVRRRDELDATRAVAPLRPAGDAIVVESDNLTAAEVAVEIEEIACRRFEERRAE